MLEFDLCACDLSFCDDIQYTYERDDAQTHSWIDHILCTSSSSNLISNAHTLHSGSNLSDHLPLLFNFHINCAAVPAQSSFSSSSSPSSSTIWSKVSDTNIESYCKYLTYKQELKGLSTATDPYYVDLHHLQESGDMIYVCLLRFLFIVLVFLLV